MPQFLYVKETGPFATVFDLTFISWDCFLSTLAIAAACFFYILSPISGCKWHLQLLVSVGHGRRIICICDFVVN